MSVVSAAEMDAWTNLSSALWWASVVLWVAGALWLAVASVLLIRIDLMQHRLPNRIVIPMLIGMPVIVVCATVSAALAGDPAHAFGEWAVPLLVRSLGGGVVLGAFYLLCALVSRGALGGGDVKLAPVIGVVLGAVGGWPAIVWGTVVALVLVSLIAVPRVLRKQTAEARQIAFGPCMLLGCWLVLIVVGVNTLTTTMIFNTVFFNTVLVTTTLV